MGLNITYYRRAKNLTQLQLAEKVSVSGNYYIAGGTRLQIRVPGNIGVDIRNIGRGREGLAGF